MNIEIIAMDKIKNNESDFDTFFLELENKKGGD